MPKFLEKVNFSVYSTTGKYLLYATFKDCKIVPTSSAILPEHILLDHNNKIGVVRCDNDLSASKVFNMGGWPEVAGMKHAIMPSCLLMLQ